MQVFMGYDSFCELEKVASQNSIKHALVITNNQSFSACGAEARLGKMPFKVTRFVCNKPNPEHYMLKQALALYQDIAPDAIIGIGGGTALDMAKLVSFFSGHKNSLQDMLSKVGIAKQQEPKPLILVPTTSGSGSEATNFAVLYIEKTKHSIGDATMEADFAIIDPVFTASLPKYVAACTAMDVLCQAIESYWSVKSDDISQTYAAEAIGLIMNNIENFVSNLEDDSRLAMSRAAHLSGKAINISKTTAAHALSYTLTSHYDIAHGHAVSLLLPHIYLYNSHISSTDAVDKRGADHVRQRICELNDLLGVSDASAAKDKIIALMHDIGLESDLTKLGVQDLSTIKQNVNGARLDNNPRKFDVNKLEQILSGQVVLV